ncbi:hypothetical protein [Bradyrhizobium sp. STM 3562]|uniref:hypothetical protein n=1 Tax=Bradyrhizobium sp. STM 3562 TaxID=578924 RepID=UPI00388D69E5
MAQREERTPLVMPAHAGIQYAAAHPHINPVSGTLDRPFSRTMTSERETKKGG